MGIKDFFKIVHNGVSIESFGTEIKLEQLEGKNICIDASWVIYSSLLALQHVDTLTDSKGQPTGHINNVIQRCLLYAGAGINQLWIFDNPEVNPIKERENEIRRERREKSTNEKAQFRMTSKHVKQIIKILDLMGVSYIITPPGIEAEQYGAYLCNGGHAMCYAMLSGDSDVLIFGGKLIRQLKVSVPGRKTKKTEYRLYDPNDILTGYELIHEQFVEAAIALGSDFAPKVPRIGPKTVIKRVLADNIEFEESQIDAIGYVNSKVDVNVEHLHESDLNEDGLREFLTKRGFEDSRINMFIEKLRE